MKIKMHTNNDFVPSVKQCEITEPHLKRLFLSNLFSLLLLGVLFITPLDIFSQEVQLTSNSQVIVFDGFITNTEGEIFKDGTYTIVFSLYKIDSNEALWKEVHNNVQLKDGIVYAELGKDPENPITLPFDEEYNVGIQIGEQVLKPHINFTSVPYSLRTKIASDVPDLSITNDKIADNTITDEKVKSVDWEKISGTEELDSDLNTVKDLPDFWRRHGNYLDTGDEFLGTINDRNLVIRVDSVQRMIFEPYGRVIIGTLQDSVQFEVIGLTTLCDAFFRGKVGVGVYPGNAKLHIDSPSMTPFRVDSANTEIFKIETDGRVSITSTLKGEEDDITSYPLLIEGEDHGIAISIHGSGLIPGQANSDNNYIAFWDNFTGLAPLFDNMTGRIEGQTALDYAQDLRNQTHAVAVAAKVTAEAVAIAVTIASAIASAGTKYNEAEDIVKLGAEIIYEAALLAIDMVNIGVTYESGSGDYAEWLPRSDVDENITPGDIVGVYGGKISKSTENADRIMSVSVAPIVLGNMPEKGKEQNFEQVAFKGQVPVKVIGLVNKGDYIIPSGNEDGTGIAVAPELVTVDELQKTLGIAWQSSKNPLMKMIKVGVGLNLRNITSIISQSSYQNEKLVSELQERKSELDKLLTDVETTNSEYEEAYKKVQLIKASLNVLDDLSQDKDDKTSLVRE